MASKNDSTWLDNIKIRTEIYNFNMAVKNVYSNFRSDKGIIIPLTMDCVKSRPLFDKSFFIRNGGANFDFMNSTGVDCEELNIALKTKAFEYSKKGKEHYLSKEDSKHLISVDMSDEQIDEMTKYEGLLEFESLKEIKPIGSYTINLEDIGLLSLYHVITRDIAKDGNVKVPLIMTKELFPMLKRVDSIVIETYKLPDLPKSIYQILIRSEAKSWVFYSLHKIIVA